LGLHPQRLHQRTPIVVGSTDEVDAVMAQVHQATDWHP
jgi:fructose-1,6-bisphosphatase